MKSGTRLVAAGISIALSIQYLIASRAAFAQTAAVPAPAADAMNPQAARALQTMGDYLRTLGMFDLRSEGTIEKVYADGQKLQFRRDVTYSVQFPDRMLVDVETDASHRRIYYNGRVMTVQAIKAGKYTSFPVSGSIAEVLAAAYDRFGLEFPLRDLFRWGSRAAGPPPASGQVVGHAEVNGRSATQYAFRQPGADFQIWIADGDQPLPLKLVIANTDDPAQPAYTAILRWDLNPAFTASSFVFQPGPADTAIDFGATKAKAR